MNCKTNKIPVHYGPIIANFSIMVFVVISRPLLSDGNAEKLCVVTDQEFIINSHF